MPVLSPQPARTVTAVTHFHVHESDAGCLPESEPYVTEDATLALDALAHLIADWSETTEPDDEDGVAAAAVSATYSCCSERGDSAEYGDALAHLERRQGICETAGRRAFEIAVCTDRDCLKYCPIDGCRTVTCVTDTDTRCWCCGVYYTPWDACPWLG
jgi:hypothetical protein